MNNEKTPILKPEEKTRLFAQMVVTVCILAIVVGLGYINKLYGNKTNTTNPDSINSDLAVVKIEDKTSKYLDIKAEYPTAGIGSEYVKQNVLNIIDEFKKQNDFSKMSDTDLENIGITPERQYQLYVKYTTATGVNTITHRIDSYAFTGGAHGGNFVETFTFTNNEKLLSINDLFVDSAKGLKLLSEKTIEYIKNNENYKDALPTDWFDEGTAPTQENYSAFEITKDTLVVVFQQYQALPYVYGNIEIPIKLAELSSVLKPEFK
ncbi:MAG: DUF3298 domain-containing protein [Minisyncoccia bacterium]